MTARQVGAALAAALVIVPACTSDEIAITEQAAESRATIVSPTLARAVAETYALPGDTAPARHVRTSSVTIDANGRAAMYGFNFLEGGFVVIAADFEFAPILAFDETSSIDLANPVPGQDDWQENMTLAIAAVRGRSASDDTERRTRIAADLDERQQWTPLLDRLASRGDVDPGEISAARVTLGPPPPDPPVPCTSYTKLNPTPLTKTAWSQDCAYNMKTPLKSDGPCGHAVTGCTATALGQVVYFHKHATLHPYNWSIMPVYNDGASTGQYERGQLLFDLGLAAHSVWGGTATTATTENAAAALHSYGYTTTLGTLSGLSTVAYPQIDARLPLLIRGASSTEGHIWIVDSYLRYKGSPLNCKADYSHAQRYYRYNWGHNGSGDAYYKENDYGGYNGNRKYITASPQ